MTPMLRCAAGYVRCSTDLQEDSPPQQQREILAFAEKHSYEIVEWFIDFGRSGTTFDQRPEFLRLWKCVQNKPRFEAVITYDESRWGRSIDPDESSHWRFEFRRRGITVVLVKTAIDANHEYAPLMQTVETLKARLDSRKTSALTKRGQVSNATRGFHTGGTAPYGYQRIAVDPRSGKKIRDLLPGQRRHQGEEKTVYALGDPAEVAIVRRIFQMRLQGLGYRGIASQLNEEGIACPKRGRWKNADQKWSIGTIMAIVENPAYRGARVYGRHPQSHLSGPTKPAWKSPPSEWTVQEDSHPAIVSKELWEKVNAAHKPYERKNRFYLGSPYVLSGLVKCGKCGYTFQGLTKKIPKKNYVGLFYQCSGFHNKGESVCSSFLLRQEEIEPHVIRAIRQRILESGFLRSVKDSIKAKLRSERTQRISIEELRRRLTKNQRALQNYFTLVESGADLPDLKERMVKLETERKAIERDIEEAQPGGLTDQNIDQLVQQVGKLVEDFETTLQQAPVYLQKSLLRRFVEKIVIDRDQKKVVVFMKRVPKVDNQFLERMNGETTQFQMALHAKVARHVQS